MRYLSILVLSFFLCFASFAETHKVNFKDVDIKEFIDAISKDLQMTIIIDPAVRGVIDIRGYEPLNDSEYLGFFESVLAAHGYTLIKLNNELYKVIPSQASKSEPVPVSSAVRPLVGDSVATKVVPVKNISAAALTPILRQLIDEAGSGNISHHEESNVIMITGRSSVISRLEKIIKTIDAGGHQKTVIVPVINAKASELVKIVHSLSANDINRGQGNLSKLTLVADDRTNAIIISGSKDSVSRYRATIQELDSEVDTQSDTKVFYLQYAKSEEIAKVLQGVSSGMKQENSAPNLQLSQKAIVTADASSNSIVVITSPDRMQAMEEVINQLDIRRAQVLIEAMIVEITENNNSQYGLQWSNGRNTMVQFSGNGASISSALLAKNRSKSKDYSGLHEISGSIRGLLASIAFSDWNMLVSALSDSTKSNILAAPSLMVLDNEEASFVVGEEVPVKTGERINGDFKNAFATIERKDVGIKLTMRPQINQGRMVQMKLQQEISNVIGANGAVDVRFGKRQLKTSVMAADQQMIVLSGLIDQRNGETVAKVPILGDIPLLGHAFKETVKSDKKRHLMLFIKPTIIRSDDLATEISRRKYSQMRREQGVIAEADGNIEEMPPYGESFNYPPEVQIIQKELGAY